LNPSTTRHVVEARIRTKTKTDQRPPGFSTTWTATELLSFQPFGCGIAGDGTPRPPNFCGGRLEMAISIATAAGPVDAILTWFCEISDDGHIPASVEEGVRLVIPG
jgi:hypothetical protein